MKSKIWQRPGHCQKPHLLGALPARLEQGPRAPQSGSLLLCAWPVWEALESNRTLHGKFHRGRGWAVLTFLLAQGLASSSGSSGHCHHHRSSRKKHYTPDSILSTAQLLNHLVLITTLWRWVLSLVAIVLYIHIKRVLRALRRYHVLLVHSRFLPNGLSCQRRAHV